MPLDDIATQRRSIGAATLPDGRRVAELPGAYGVLVIVLTPDGPQLQGSHLTPDDADEAAHAARDTALALLRAEPDLIGYVRGCWERRRLRATAREMNALLKGTADDGQARPTVRRRATDLGGSE